MGVATEATVSPGFTTEKPSGLLLSGNLNVTEESAGLVDSAGLAMKENVFASTGFVSEGFVDTNENGFTASAVVAFPKENEGAEVAELVALTGALPRAVEDAGAAVPAFPIN